MMYLEFEIVTFEILDFEGHRYEELSHLCWWCASVPQLYKIYWNRLYSFEQIMYKFEVPLVLGSKLQNPWFWRSQVWGS